jgi:thiamine-monophosphate kinase
MTAFEAQDHAYLRELLGGDGLSGPGDDAAVFAASGQLVATCDSVIEGVHYFAEAEPAAIAHKLVERNFSDLAAMGALPTQILLACSFAANWDEARRRAFYRGVQLACARHDAAWIGGDIAATPGPSTFTLTALGRPAGPRVLRRDGLRPGDLLAVSGELGDSLGSGHHMSFEARVGVGARLAVAHEVHACIDISDGLALDLERMLAASGGLGATLEAAALPLRDSLRAELQQGELELAQAVQRALSDGEDYELLVAFAPTQLAAVEADAELPAQLGRPIGRVDVEPGLRLRDPDASVRPLQVRGWLHGHD